MTNIKYERVKQVADGDNQNEEIELENETQVRKHYITARISGSDGKKKSYVNKVIATIGLILCYFALSIGLTFYQRFLLQDFHFPLFVVLYHLFIKLVLSAVLRIIYRCATKKTRILLDWRTSLRRISPTGLASGIDIGFSNWGLELVPISLYTMTKSTTIIFILFFAILLKLEKKSWSLMLIVVMISGGLCMFTYKSTQFDALGFSFLLFASFSSGIRWSFAQLIMQKSKLGLHNPIDMIFHMQPWMILSILPFTIGFEGKQLFENLTNISNYDTNMILYVWSKVSIGAFIAFAMEISEFLVLTNTSSLTLSVAGVFKEICQLVLAFELYGDPLSLINVLGLVMCLGGICCHVVHKFWTYTDEQQLIDNFNNYDDVDESGSSFQKNIVTFERKLSTSHIKLNKGFNGQHRPLLINGDDEFDSDSAHSNRLNCNNSDEEDVVHETEARNSSDVLYDVLKRRER